MPMALRPATTATRADSALIERAISSASPITREDLMPGAGSSSYSVTTGPGLAFTISPRTPKSCNTPSSARELASSSDLLSGWRSAARGAVSTFTDGNSNLLVDFRAGVRGAAFLRGARAAASSSSSPSSNSSSLPRRVRCRTAAPVTVRRARHRDSAPDVRTPARRISSARSTPAICRPAPIALRT